MLKLKYDTCAEVNVTIQGMLDNDVYLIDDGEAVVVVDPSADADEILAALDGRTPAAILLTHCHFDHVGAAKALRDATGAPVYASAIDGAIICGERKRPAESRPFEPCPVDHYVEDGDELTFGGSTWRAIHTPGHTRGGMCYFLDPAKSARGEGLPILVSGDTLFRGCTGRMDFEGGSRTDMAASMRKLAELPDETIVLPGHYQPTAISIERRDTFPAFL